MLTLYMLKEVSEFTKLISSTGATASIREPQAGGAGGSIAFCRWRDCIRCRSHNAARVHAGAEARVERIHSGVRENRQRCVRAV